MKEPRIIQIGNIIKNGVRFTNRQVGRVFCVDGISPALNICGGGNHEPMIMVKRVNKCKAQKKEID